ncbi:glutaredoxin family protein [Pontibacillus salicampi]|uniref:Glutaredoxin family protein n=1 Tax=Pontibacillus salicampi TaxID=1449801 RepID=A0ABV6LSY6_9BACI
MTQQVLFYTKPHCPLCEDAKHILQELQQEFTFQIVEKDIYEDDVLLERYQLKIPVIKIGGEEVDFGQISEHLIRNRLQSKNA